MKKLIAVLFVFICASASAEDDKYKGLVISGTEYAVTVNWSSATVKNVLPAAEEYCQKYNKHAQFGGRIADTHMMFHCVAMDDKEKTQKN